MLIKYEVYLVDDFFVNIIIRMDIISFEWIKINICEVIIKSCVVIVFINCKLLVGKVIKAVVKVCKNIIILLRSLILVLVIYNLYINI